MKLKLNGTTTQTLSITPRPVIDFEFTDDAGNPVNDINLISTNGNTNFILPPSMNRKLAFDIITAMLQWGESHAGNKEDFGRWLAGQAVPIAHNKNMTGPGVFIWQIENIIIDGIGGDINRIADKVIELGFRRVNIKIANEHLAFGFHPKTKVDQVPLAIKAFRERGLSVWGWHYIYGTRPEEEAKIGASRALALGLDGYTIDAESEFDNQDVDMTPIAKRFMDELVQRIGFIPVGFSSFKYPDYHRRIPWKAFLDKSNLNQPQVYWEEDLRPLGASIEFQKSLEQNQKLSEIPIIPIGSVYPTKKWPKGPTVAQVEDFNSAVLKSGAPAIDWYALHTLVQRQDWMDSVKRENRKWA